MMQSKIMFIFISFLWLGTLFTSAVSAQTMDGGTGVNQDTTQPLPQTDDTVGGTATQNQTGDMNWWWLIPLIALPILYMLYRSSKDRDRDTYREQDIVGARGGEAKRDESEDDWI